MVGGGRNAGGSTRARPQMCRQMPRRPVTGTFPSRSRFLGAHAKEPKMRSLILWLIGIPIPIIIILWLVTGHA
jgi:hypothetical protein